MLLRKKGFFVFAGAIALFAAFLIMGAAGTAVSAASVQDELRAQPDWHVEVTVDAANTAFQDLGGNPTGSGSYAGRLRCKGDKCSQKMSAVLSGIAYEFRFSTLGAIDVVSERVVVEGVGSLTRELPLPGEQRKERFRFTAVFENNRDGTVSSRYTASNPAASFIIPVVDGTFVISGR